MGHIIGFTGTRSGMTDSQKAAVKDFILGVLAAEPSTTGLHGDCVGADDNFHLACREAGMGVSQRPCTFTNMRAWTDAVEIAEPCGPMQRNRQIVTDCSVLLACPPNDKEILKGSGTWATIRMGRRANKQVVIIYPDGSVVVDNEGAYPDVAQSN